MEVCVDTLESALNAFHGQACRIELCSSLNEGGLTPTYGLFKSIRSHLDRLDPERRFKINCMIRLRAGDFNYTDTEMETMMEDAKKLIELDTDGLVFGALKPEGDIDEVLVSEFCKLTPTKVTKTFHRAFDVCRDWRAAYEQLGALGFDTLLTSGQNRTALEGREVIAELVSLSRRRDDAGPSPHRVKILPGSGINASNLETILSSTRCDEFHASCRVTRPSRMTFRNAQVPMGSSSIDEFAIFVSDQDKIKQLVDIFNEFYQKPAA